jgi:hypothetical protein
MFLIPCLSGRLALAEKRELETRDLVALELYLILKHNLTSLILYEYFAELLIFITDIWGASGGHLGAESAAPGRSKRIEGSGGGSLVCLFVISTISGIIPILVKFIITLVVIVIFVAITLFLGQSVGGREGDFFSTVCFIMNAFPLAGTYRATMQSEDRQAARPARRRSAPPGRKGKH